MLRNCSVTEKLQPAIGIADKGRSSPTFSQPDEALDLLTEAMNRTGYEGKFKFGIDPASQEFFNSGIHDLGFKWEESHPMSKPKISDLKNELIDEYSIGLLEDHLGRMTRKHMGGVQQDLQD